MVGERFRTFSVFLLYFVDLSVAVDVIDILCIIILHMGSFAVQIQLRICHR